MLAFRLVRDDFGFQVTDEFILKANLGVNLGEKCLIQTEIMFSFSFFVCFAGNYKAWRGRIEA